MSGAWAGLKMANVDIVVYIPFCQVNKGGIAPGAFAEGLSFLSFRVSVYVFAVPWDM